MQRRRDHYCIVRGRYHFGAAAQPSLSQDTRATASIDIVAALPGKILHWKEM
jgi:hypothetical protein